MDIENQICYNTLFKVGNEYKYFRKKNMNVLVLDITEYSLPL